MSQTPVPAAKVTRGRAVIIDDDDLLRSVMARLLERVGYAVEGYASGDEAIARLDVKGEYALLLIDVVMPGSSGVETVRSLRALGIDAPMLLMSGRPNPGSDAGGADGFIGKPFTMDSLDQALARLRASRSSSG